MAAGSDGVSVEAVEVAAAGRGHTSTDSTGKGTFTMREVEECHVETEQGRPVVEGAAGDEWEARLRQDREDTVSAQNAATERPMSQGRPAIRKLVRSAVQQ